LAKARAFNGHKNIPKGQRLIGFTWQKHKKKMISEIKFYEVIGVIFEAN
jgi:hypothetical protein